MLTINGDYKLQKVNTLIKCTQTIDFSLPKYLILQYVYSVKLLKFADDRTIGLIRMLTGG